MATKHAALIAAPAAQKRSKNERVQRSFLLRCEGLIGPSRLAVAGPQARAGVPERHAIRPSELRGVESPQANAAVAGGPQSAAREPWFRVE